MSDTHLIARGASLARYIVVKHLGTGGQGVVYAAYDPELDRRVALKLLRPDVGSGSADDRRTRLLREAQEHARLEHPNVVPILHVGTFFDQLYLAMPFMAGGTLKDWLAAAPRAPVDVLARFIEAGRGLAAAHARGLVHRDFKPDNVMLDERGVAHVTDFGLAQRGSAAGGAGTTRYMSPEQHARTQSVGPAADQFSFCVALCEALSGQLPELVAGAVKLPSRAIPPWLRPVLIRGLSAKPEERYPSMDALLSVLEAGPEARRRLASRVGLTLLLVLSSLGIGWLLTRETPAERTQRECLARVQASEAEAWGPARVSQMAQRFSSVAGSGGSDTFARVKSLLEPEVRSWSTATALACSRPVSAAHERCLESRWRVLQSLSELFATAEPEVVAGALNAVHREVLPVAGCLTTSVASPRVVPDSEVDQRLRPTLARTRVLRAAGQYREALVAAMAVVEQAHAQGAVRVEAEAQLQAGLISNALHRAETEVVLLGAVLLAEQASADEERARAWLALIVWYASRGDYEAAARARDQADSIIERLGRPDHLEAQYLNQVGQLLRGQRDDREAALAFKRALELQRKHLGESHPQVLDAVENYALTLKATEARPLLQSVLDVRAAAFGEQHPETAKAAHNLGVVVEELNCTEALVPLRRALAILEGQTPRDVCRVAREHFALARAHACISQEQKNDGAPAIDEELRGLRLTIHDDCAGTVSSAQELTWLRDFMKSRGGHQAELRRIDELLLILKAKEPLPDPLFP